MAMTLEAFAHRHPKLYRLAMRGAADGIRKHGLLTAAEAARRAGVALPKTPRRQALTVTLPDGTDIVMTDNRPLSFARLARVLEDGITPEDWLAMLNARVFFWPCRSLAQGNLAARKARGYVSEWQIYDTRQLLGPVWARTAISPINSGATLYTPQRRGLATFAALDGLDFPAWQRARGRKTPDQIKEVTVLGSIADAGKALTATTPA